MTVFRKPLPKRDELFGVMAVAHVVTATPANVRVRKVLNKRDLSEELEMFVPDGIVFANEENQLKDIPRVLAGLHGPERIAVESEAVLEVTEVGDVGLQQLEPLGFVPQADDVESLHGFSLQLGWYA